MNACLDLSGICIERAGRPIVRDLSATIPSGGWFGVVGANGSGKTTLLRAVAGRLQIADGRCRINGKDLTSDRAGRAEAIGFAPPLDRLPLSLKSRELLELAGDTVGAQRERNSSLWVALGISELLDKPVGDYSSGMRQRVSIALAFAKSCSIVILDEPFNWLDPVAAFDTRIALAEMIRPDFTLITALHDLTTLCASCDGGIVMAQGQVSLALGKDDLRRGAKDISTFERSMIAALR